MIHEEGLQRVFDRHARMAAATRAAAAALGLKLVAPDAPSPALTGIYVPSDVDGGKLVAYLRDRMGVTFAGGQDQLKGKIVRIAHLGYIGVFDVVTAIAALEMASAISATLYRSDAVSVPRRNCSCPSLRSETMYRVLVSDKLSAQGLEILKSAPDIEVDNITGLKPPELAEKIGPYHGLIVRSASTVTAEVIAAADNLRVIGRAGIGVDNIDVPAATKRGIVVMNTPAGNNITTAEHAISMMLALARSIPQATASMKGGKWEKSRFIGSEVFNKTLGIVGIGNIGSVVADRALGLKMKVIAYDPFISQQAAQRLGVELVSLDDLYARSDFITVHTPLNAETRDLIGAAAFAKMKKGVRVINCARGGIVDEEALAAAISEGQSRRRRRRRVRQGAAAAGSSACSSSTRSSARRTSARPPTKRSSTSPSPSRSRWSITSPAASFRTPSTCRPSARNCWRC